MTIWCAGAPPEPAAGLYLWDGPALAEGAAQSILRYTEQHAQRLRANYLARIHAIGEARVGGARLVERLAVDAGFSYWWMTLLVEKNPWKSPAIADAIRLLAIEEIVTATRPASVLLVGAQRPVEQALRAMCAQLGIGFTGERRPRQRGPVGLATLYRWLPLPAKALLTLARRLHQRWPLRRDRPPAWAGGEQALFVCAYFFNLDAGAAKQGRFHSHYWEGLHGLLARLGLRPNWLHLYHPHAAVPTAAAAQALTARFNANADDGAGSHAFLDGTLDWALAWRVLRRWTGLLWLSWQLAPAQAAFQPAGSALSLWPVLREDWYNSLRGPAAISNLLWIAQFDAAMARMPHQRRGLYLAENQAWERALVHAWRKHAHGELIAVSHVTVRFWDLRNFFDPRTVSSTDPYPMPRADLLALNGAAALAAMRAAGYPADDIVECEALRFGHLNAMRAPALPVSAPARRILILGDYMAENTMRMLRLLQAALPLLAVRPMFTLKPHPNFPVRADQFAELGLTVVTDPLGRLLLQFDLAYASNMTSAAVDASLAGLPVIVMLDDRELNYSPLRGQAGTRFVSRPDELAQALTEVAPAAAPMDNFFFLDPALRRWEQVLARRPHQSIANVSRS